MPCSFQGMHFGDKPPIVLSHSIYDPEDPLDAARLFLVQAAREQTAALSTQASTESCRGHIPTSRSIVRKLSSTQPAKCCAKLERSNAVPDSAAYLLWSAIRKCKSVTRKYHPI